MCSPCAHGTFSGRNYAKKDLAETSARPVFSMVPKGGLEPARRVTTLDFESSASANSATSATVAFVDLLCQTTIIY